MLDGHGWLFITKCFEIGRNSKDQCVLLRNGVFEFVDYFYVVFDEILRVGLRVVL